MPEEMSDDWIEDCKRYWGKILTGVKGHWCPEWDYLPIDETTHEFETCCCDLSKLTDKNDD